MASNKTYWKNIDQLDPTNEEVQSLEQNEFASQLPKDFLTDERTLADSNTSRRDFLNMLDSVLLQHRLQPVRVLLLSLYLM